MQQLTDFENLYMSDEFARIDSYTKQFDLFEVMKVTRKELVHSDILAALLNPCGSHNMGYAFVNMFIKSLNLERKQCIGTPLPLSTIISATNSSISISRELYRIDLLLEFKDIKLVVAIENKIDAGEENTQIARYQKILEEKFPEYRKVMVFLTIDGRAPETNDTSSDIPIYLMTYKVISRISELCRDSACLAAQHFLDQFILHLENHMNGNREIEGLCFELFKKHPETYRHIAQNYPKCVSKNIAFFFGVIENEIKKDTTMKTNLSIPENKSKDIDCMYLDVRRDIWPEGIKVRIYKYEWLAVFPFAPEENLVVQYFKDISPIKTTTGWGGYYFTADPYLEKTRCVRAQGNEMTEADVQEVLNRVRTFMKEIDEAVLTTKNV